MSFEIVLPTGEIIRVGDGGGKKIRKSSTGYHLKHLFMGHQGTLGIVTEATLELVPRPEAEFAAFFAFDDYLKAHRTVGGIVTSGIATLAGTVLFDEKKIDYLRRDDEAFIPMPPWVNSIVATALYGTKAEVTEASKILMRLGRSRAVATPGTRWRWATGPPVTTDTPTCCTAGFPTGALRRCPGTARTPR